MESHREAPIGRSIEHPLSTGRGDAAIQASRASSFPFGLLRHGPSARTVVSRRLHARNDDRGPECNFFLAPGWIAAPALVIGANRDFAGAPRFERAHQNCGRHRRAHEHQLLKEDALNRAEGAEQGEQKRDWQDRRHCGLPLADSLWRAPFGGPHLATSPVACSHLSWRNVARRISVPARRARQRKNL